MSTFLQFAARYAISTAVDLDAERRPVLNASDGEAIASTFLAVDLVAGEEPAPAAANGAAAGDDDNAAAAAAPPPAALRLGAGTLYVTTRRVVWVPDAQQQQADAVSVALAYRQIVMHAVATDAASFSRPCVWLQLDDGGDAGGEGEEEDDDAAAALPAPELRMVPADASQGERGWGATEERSQGAEGNAARALPSPLSPPATNPPSPKQHNTVEPLFQALCDNSALNPDTDAEEQTDNELVFDRLQAMAGAAAATAGLGAAPAEEDEEEEEQEQEEGTAAR
jgi:hypothetical protein